MLIGVAGQAAPAKASTTYLCSGKSYATCTSAGYTAHGYDGTNADGTAVNSHSYWTMFAGHNCTNYAAYMAIQNGASTPSVNLGDGGSWAVQAAKSTTKIPVNGTAAAGAIAQWNAGTGGAGAPGHVDYVEAVVTTSDGKTTITVSEDNYDVGPFTWKTITSGDSDWPSNFIHFADLTPPAPVSGDYNHDGYSDLHKIAFSGTTSANVEDHVLTGINFQNWLAHVTTAWTEAPSRNAYYLLGDYNHDANPDLYMVALNPSTGHIEVHILAGPSYTQPLADYTTPLTASSLGQIEVALGGYNQDNYPDLYVAYFTGTGSGKIELHVLNGTNFQNELGAWVTPMGAASTNDQQFVIGDYNHDGVPDIYLVVLGGVGQHEVDVHVLLGPNYAQANWAGHWATSAAPAHSTDERALIGDYNHDGYGDLYLVTYATPEPGGTTATEVHVITGTNFAGPDLGDWRTVSSGASQSQVEFALG